MYKPTVVFDFDGVIHSYTSGWQGIDVANDAPNTDVITVIKRLRESGYSVAVTSTRCKENAGRLAVENYLKKWDIDVDAVTMHKPPAVVYIDDRAICYTPDMDLFNAVVDFKPWTDKGGK